VLRHPVSSPSSAVYPLRAVPAFPASFWRPCRKVTPLPVDAEQGQRKGNVSEGSHTHKRDPPAKSGQGFSGFTVKFPVDIHSCAMHSAAMIAKELVAASTEPLILSLLAQGESYGYALIQEVKHLSEDKIEWTDGMLYPVLHRMEANGWIKSRWVQIENGRKRKYYSIKKDGHKALKEKREQWAAIASVLGALWKEQYV
jgi:PadR family transcriptional regulator, regulatory protein PadR